MSSRRLIVIFLSAIGGIGLAWLGPSDWSAGPARLEVHYLNTAVGNLDIELGSRASFTAVENYSGGGFAIEAVDGFPLDAPINVSVTVTDPSRTPVLGDIEVRIIDTDATAHLVPVLGSTSGIFEATRRPPDKSKVVLAVLGLAIVLWVTEVVPLFVTSLTIPVALAVAEVGSAAETLAPFFDPIIVLFFGGFLMAEGMQKVGLDHLVAVTIVDVAGGGAVRLYCALIALSAFLSMWMSNTAAVTVLIPIAIAVTSPLESEQYQKAVVLGIAYAATVGGVGSAIGTPANPLAITFIERLTGRDVSFVEWFGFGLPMVFLFLPIMAVYLWLISDVKVSTDRFEASAAVARRERHSAGRLTTPQLQVLAVFALVVLLWVTQSQHGVNTGIVALAGAIGLFVLGRIDPADLARISWPTLLTFGGGLTLGVFMVSSGTSDWLVTGLGGLAGWPRILAVGAVAVVALGLTTVASNTAAAATLIPLAVPLAGIVGVEAVLLVVVVAIASSIDFALVIGTPPTMLAHSTGLFTSREILRKGAFLNLVGIVLLVAVVVPIWRLLGLI